MTYCIGLCLKDGLVFLSDTRTNAGVDQIGTFRKMSIFQKGNDRFFAMMSAGNLAITQSVKEILLQGQQLIHHQYKHRYLTHLQLTIYMLQ